MTRWVVCDKCARAWRAGYPGLLPARAVDEGKFYRGQLYGASKDGPAERGTMRRGAARYDMVCDHCNRELLAGLAAWVIGILVDGQTKPPTFWERHFIDPEVQPPSDETRWQTQHDDQVCSVCAPWDGVAVRDTNPPHPCCENENGCRCVVR